MRAIDQYKRTNIYLLSPIEARDMAAINALLAERKQTPVAIAHDPGEHKASEYTVRHFEEIEGKTALVDAVYKVVTPKIIEQTKRTVIAVDAES